MQTLRQARRKIAATTTVPATPKWAVAEAVMTTAPLVASASSPESSTPTAQSPP